MVGHVKRARDTAVVRDCASHVTSPVYDVFTGHKREDWPVDDDLCNVSRDG